MLLASIAGLLATADALAPRGPYLKAHVRFMPGKPWVRHDEHFHVDFGLPSAA